MKPLIRVFAVLLVFSATALAQPFGPGPGGGKPLERLERVRTLRMVGMLDLKEDQSVRFMARLKDHQDARHELHRQRNEILDKIERLVRNHADEKEFDEPFSQVLAIDQKISEENRNFFVGLKDLLTTEQRAKFLLFERRFEGELRDAIRQTWMHRTNPNGQ